MSTEHPQGFDVKKAASRNAGILFIVLALLLGAGGLHATLSKAEQTLRNDSAAVSELFAMTQRMAMLAQQFNQNRDDKTLEQMKLATSNALALNENLTPKILAAAAPADDLAVKSATDMLKSYIDNGYTLISIAPGTDIADKAAAMAAIAQTDIPKNWMPFAETYEKSAAQKIQYMDYGSFALYGLVALLVFFGLSATAKGALKYIGAQNENIERMSATDMLTQLYNRATLFKVAAMLMSGAARHKRGLAVLLIDIDNFKQINDTYGRTMGDATIHAVAETLDRMLRNSDVIGRVGGTEFAVFLPSTDEYRATFVAEKLRAAVEALHHNIKDNIILLRVSIGIAEMQPHHKNPAQFLLSAETALRHAKESGRNCIVTQSNMEVIHVTLPGEQQPAVNDSDAYEEGYA
jgi:diguanylate cyclase (GGDEF)-like protein